MSGGSLDYFYYQLEEVGEGRIRKCSKEEKILSRLCVDLSAVLHDLEWWYSDDIGEEEFKKTWNKFCKKWLKGGIK